MRDLSNGVRWVEMLGNPATHCKTREGNDDDKILSVLSL